MRRRDFITLVAGAAAWPFAAHAQQPKMPVVGFLGTGSPQADAFRVAAVRQGLTETGYVEGQNAAFEFRWAENQYERLPALAAELVHQGVAVIVSIGGFSSAMAAKSSTATIPIVFATGGDPIQSGLVASLSRPGSNVTGVNFLVGVFGRETARGPAPDGSKGGIDWLHREPHQCGCRSRDEKCAGGSAVSWTQATAGERPH